MKLVLDIDALCVRRGPRTILQDVSWQVREGEHWVIMGPNGCGKTTLLNVLAGYVTPTAGEVRLLEHTYGESDWREIRPSIGLVSANAAAMLNGEDYVEEIVATGREAIFDIWEPPSRKLLREAQAFLEMTEAQHLAKQPWAVLSQGEKQRVLISRALFTQPQIMILDEPCAGLDPVARETFLCFLQDFCRQSRIPVVLVTHHVEEILPNFTKTLLLSNGKVCRYGETKSCLNSKNLSQAFQSKIVLRKRGGRFYAVVQGRKGRAV